MLNAVQASSLGSETGVRTARRLRFFIAGIMQGSLAEKVLHEQSYRKIIKELLAEAFPEAEIYDPLADHQRSLEYDRATGQQVFWGHNLMCRQVDVLVAYLPEASMGTAIEMWEAYRHGAVVVSISPLRRNWVVRFLSHQIYANLPEFAASVRNGQLGEIIEANLGNTPREAGMGMNPPSSGINCMGAAHGRVV
jgi:hypothetical protein